MKEAAQCTKLITGWNSWFVHPCGSQKDQVVLCTFLSELAGSGHTHTDIFLVLFLPPAWPQWFPWYPKPPGCQWTITSCPSAQPWAAQLCCYLRWCRRAAESNGERKPCPAVNKHCSSLQARHLPGTTRGWRDCSLLQFLIALIKNAAPFLFKHSQHT